MLTELRRRMDKLSKNFNKELENIRKNQTDLKDTITEIRNTTERINSRPDDIEQVSDMENIIMEITQSEQQKETNLMGTFLRDLWDNIKHINIPWWLR